MPVFPEGRAPADMILPQSRLRFMDAQGHGRSQRSAEVFLRQSLLIQPMPGFMHHRIK